MRMFDMANDSNLFQRREGLATSGQLINGNQFQIGLQQFVPFYEAKMCDHFDHRYASLLGVAASNGRKSRKLIGWYSAIGEDPNEVAQPQYWVAATEVDKRLAGRWTRNWFLGWRDICRSTDQRTVIASLIPRAAVGDKFLLMMPSGQPAAVACLYANLCSFALDYAARQKIGGTSLKYFTLKQLPVLPPLFYGNDTLWSPGIRLAGWLLPRVLELTYTAWDLEAFAQDCGSSGPPFRWEEDRRFLLRCELDAAFFHLYLGPEIEWRQQPAVLTQAFPTPRDAVAYIMDTFPIVKRKDEAKFNGDYRTKRVILEIYDALATSMQTGQPYQSRLDPPPADPQCCHPAKS